MKKCICCLKHKIFKKLKDGMCLDCYLKYKEAKKIYENLLISIKNNTFNKETISYEIKSICTTMEIFENCNVPIKSSDCKNLLKLIPNLNQKIMTEKINYINPNTTLPYDNTSSECRDTPSVINNFAPTEINDKTIISDNNIYDNTKKLLDLILNSNPNITNLCQYTFKLKDIYLPILEKNNITEIDNINISRLINTLLGKLSVLLKSPPDKLYNLFNYIAFSLQTTGLKLSSNNIIEIGAIKVKFGQVEDTFYTLINPLKSIGLTTQNSTNITNTMLENSPRIDTVFTDFLTFCDNLTLVSHNSNFNFGFLNYNYLNLFNKKLDLSTECTMKLYRKRFKSFHGEPPKNFSLESCYDDILPKDTVSLIKNIPSNSLSAATGTFKLYEILKNKYK